MGLGLTDRIALRVPARYVDLLQHREWIMAETLAVSLEADSDDDSVVAITRVV
jgi:hypothetical protein